MPALNQGSTADIRSIQGIDARIIQIDGDGNITYMNSLMAKSLMINASSVIGRDFTEFDAFSWGPGILRLLVKKVRKHRKQVEITRHYIDPDLQRSVFYRIAVHPLDEDGALQILVQDVTKYQRLKEVFERFVSPQVIERMVDMPDTDFFQRDRYELSVLFADLRGFTAMCNDKSPDVVCEVVDDFIQQMVKTAWRNDATVDKVIGDEIMLLFGAPMPKRNHALKAVLVALEMQKIHGRLMRVWSERGLPPLPLGIGVATGEVVVGCVGSEQFSSYTVLGRTVNLGARLCSIAEPNQTLLSRRTFEMAKKAIQHNPAAMGDWNVRFGESAPVDVKGFPDPVQVISVSAE